MLITITLLASLVDSVFDKRKKRLLFTLMALKKENQILKRTVTPSQIKLAIKHQDRIFLATLLHLCPDLKRRISLVQPETVLRWWKKYCSRRWFFPKPERRKGRPPISVFQRKLILEMKKLNRLWGNLRIAGEMKKIDHDLSRETVRRVIQKGRNDGDIKPTGSWKRFLKSHWDSLFACDFLTVETVFSKRLYVFFIKELKSRKIVQYGITPNPKMGFVRNQLKAFMFDRLDKPTHLIHDNSGELKWFDYQSVGITGIATIPYSPNMNAYAERFVRSVRQECLDHFIIFNLPHLRNLMREYVKYYNTQRPHQGIHNTVPVGNKSKGTGKIKREKILFGLHTCYSREAA